MGRRAGYFALAMLLFGGLPACAATLAEVNAEIVKANRCLQDKSDAASRAKTLSAAVENLHGALELLAKVEGLTPEQTEAKSSEIMATIFWCKKMMPLDLSGRSVETAAASNKGPSGGDEKTAEPAGGSAGPQLDELAFNREKTYAEKNPNDVEGIVVRFASVAAAYPQSKWGQQASQAAAQSRTKLEAMRADARKIRGEKLQRLEFAELLASVDKDLAAESAEPKKRELSHEKADIECLQAVWQRLLAACAMRLSPLNLTYTDLGVNKKGWIQTAKKEGVMVAAEKDAAPVPVPWSEFGAKNAVRLAEKQLPLADADCLEQLCIAATVTEDYVAAERLFSRLLGAAPERVKQVAAYFERAQSGYKTDAEGSGRIRLKEIKDLVKTKSFTQAMTQLAALQEDSAKNSSLQLFLTELDQYRRALRKQYQIDDAGNPITPFEQKVRKIFGGDVKLDEQSGAIEVTYDFSQSTQLQDWAVVDRFGKNSGKLDWGVANGRVQCLGQKTILMWKFPVSAFVLSADVVYSDGAHRVVVHACMNQDNQQGVLMFCKDGAARVSTPHSWWYSSSRFVWRAGENATLRCTVDPKGDYPFGVEVNDKYAVSGKFPTPKGNFGFDFDGGKGSVGAVHIKGTLDMEWFKQILAGIR